MRFYGFGWDEITTEKNPFLDERFDPKLAWALRNLHFFPVEINRADRETLLRVPGFGTRSVSKILRARRAKLLRPSDLEVMRISLKRARYFITVGGKTVKKTALAYEQLESTMLSLEKPKAGAQPSLFDVLQTHTGEI